MSYRGARPSWARIGRLVIVAVVLLASTIAGAVDSRITFLADRLRKSDDFKVRANAALALGATNDDDAVPPLCDGLGDSNDIVRKHSAIALERLKRASSLDCLTRRAGTESDSAVKLAIQRAVDAIKAAGGSSGGTAPVTGAKYYIALSPVTNKSSRAQSEVDRLVQGAISAKLQQLGGYQIAPQGESVAAAKAEIDKRKLKGFYLAIVLDKLEYAGGNLRATVRIAVSTYPGKDLKGELSKGGTIGASRPGDTATEDQLVTAIVAAATESFAQAFK